MENLTKRIQEMEARVASLFDLAALLSWRYRRTQRDFQARLESLGALT